MSGGGWLGSSPAGARPRVELQRSRDQVELTVDGIAYSVFGDEAPWSGYVWDALAGALLLHPSPAPRILLLGCGGGTVLILARHLRPEATLVAVELEPFMLAHGRQHGLEATGAEIHEGDGVEFLRRTRRSFDVIVDDMFAPRAGGLERPVADEAEHLGRARARLAPGGFVVSNATTDDDPPGLELTLESAHVASFAHVVSLDPPRGLNRVFVGCDRPLDRARWEAERRELDPRDGRAVGNLLLRSLKGGQDAP